MPTISYFKTTKKTKRFNKNQNVWIRFSYSNHLHIYYKYRGKGRYVNGIIDRFSKTINEIKTINISDEFYNKITN